MPRNIVVGKAAVGPIGPVNTLDKETINVLTP
jgi:hypothetical protein